ncbi:MAG: hypothetical protein H7A40_06685 [Chlamydiales bacterium]|nr:hypothetical protein [Chlamydiales bacterium]
MTAQNITLLNSQATNNKTDRNYPSDKTSTLAKSIIAGLALSAIVGTGILVLAATSPISAVPLAVLGVAYIVATVAFLIFSIFAAFMSGQPNTSQNVDLPAKAQTEESMANIKPSLVKEPLYSLEPVRDLNFSLPTHDYVKKTAYNAPVNDVLYKTTLSTTPSFSLPKGTVKYIELSGNEKQTVAFIQQLNTILKPEKIPSAHNGNAMDACYSPIAIYRAAKMQ